MNNTMQYEDVGFLLILSRYGWDAAVQAHKRVSRWNASVWKVTVRTDRYQVFCPIVSDEQVQR